MGDLSSSAVTGPGRATDLADSDRMETRPLESSGAGDESERPVGYEQGEKVGRYVVLRQLAHGGMSVVYVAYDPELNRQVALKVMRGGGPEGTHQASERLLREAQAMAQLSHTNIVHVYDVGVVGDRVYMAMEYVRGETVEKWVQLRNRTWREIVAVLVRAGRGLAAAHAAGLLHLDFKPRNVLVGEDDEVRVVDFGLARPPRSDDPAGRPGASFRDDPLTTSGRLVEPITQYGVVMGTPGYMAPEQLVGDQADARSDQFAFCVALWITLFSERPFHGSTARQLNEAIVDGDIRSPADTRGVPPRVRRLLERGLSVEPDDRFPSVAALLDALERDPARKLKGAAAVAVAVGLVGAAGYGFARNDEPGGPQCHRADELLDGVWDADRRTRAVQAIEADGRAFAPDVARRVAGAIDRYSEAWLTMHSDSCAATHIRGEQSPEALDLRTRCLKVRLVELEAFTDLLLEADRTTVEKASEAVDRLVPLSVCEDIEDIQARAARTPIDPALRERLDDAKMLYARVQALNFAGHYSVALVHALALVLEAEAIGHAPFVAESKRLAGTVLVEFGNAKAGEQMLTDAMLAAESAGLDNYRLEQAMELMFVIGLHRGDPPRAHAMARHAEAIADRIDAPPEQFARLYANLGAVLGAEGRAEESMASYARALETHAGVIGRDDSNLASIHLGLGAAKHLLADYDKALFHFRRAREILERTFGPRHPRTATAYENIATSLHSMGRFEEALEMFLRANSIYERALVPEERRGTVLNGLAAVYEGLGQYETAAIYFRRVVDAMEAADVEAPALAAATGNLGLVQLETGRYEAATHTLEKALRLLVEMLGPRHPYYLYFRIGLGRAHLEAGRFEEAVAALVPPCEQHAANPSAYDPLHRGEGKLALARALEALGDAELDASLDFARSKTIDEWLVLARREIEQAGRAGERAKERLDTFEVGRPPRPLDVGAEISPRP